MRDFELSEISWNFFEDVGRECIHEVTEAIHEDIQRTVPVDNGDLKRSIEKSYSDDLGVISVGTDHWYVTEYGANPHIIEAKNKQVLAGNGKIFGKRVNHPGSRAQPFMRTSLYKLRTLRGQS